MKTKNIIVITNLRNGDKAMVVTNFSDENVKSAISDLLTIHPKHLKCTASSMSGGIYEVTKTYRGLHDDVKSIFEEEKTAKIMPVYLQISYATLYE